MKVWLLPIALASICLSSQTKIDWGRLPHNSFSGFPEGSGEPSTVCTVAQTNCRCCQMMQKVENMTNRLNEKLHNLEKEYIYVTNIHQEITSKQSAFSASLFPDINTFNCIATKEDEGIALIFKGVFLDVGHNYDMMTGVYTSPYSGFYIISLTVFHDAGNQHNEMSCVRLYKNTDIIAAANDTSIDREDSATITVALHLNVHDLVSVALMKDCILCEHEFHFNVFNIFLISAD